MKRERPGAGGAPAESGAIRPRSLAKHVGFGVLAALAFLAFIGLGTWQIHRRAWKLDLIERVDRRVHAPPADAPGPADWPGVTVSADEYRHVRVSGVFANEKETLVKAATELGGGFWVLTPLRTAQGFTVLVNRGFVPPDRRDRASRAAGESAGETAVTGLLRITEPKGGFLRSNDPAADRWYSRDIAAIAEARHLGVTAPYFIDADATPNPGGLPVGGLTVIAFPNSHLQYAITWYALAALLAAAMIYVTREERRGRS